MNFNRPSAAKPTCALVFQKPSSPALLAHYIGKGYKIAIGIIGNNSNVQNQDK